MGNQLICAAGLAALLGVIAVYRLLGLRQHVRMLCAWETDGSTVVVRDRDGWRELLADDGTRAMVHTRVSTDDTLTSGVSYTDGFHLSVALAGPPKRVLFIGAGGCLGPRQFAALYPGAEIDVVERDPRVLAAAQRFFWLQQSSRLRVHVADGATFLAASADAFFDVIVLDAYTGAGQFPNHFATVGFFEAGRAKLKPGGVLCANLIDRQSQMAAAALASVFREECRVFEVPPDCAVATSYANCIALGVRPPRRPAWRDLVHQAAGLDARVRFAADIARRPTVPAGLTSAPGHATSDLRSIRSWS